MQVIVKFSDRGRSHAAVWYTTLAAAPTDQVILGEAYMIAFAQAVRTANGPPPGTRTDSSTTPATHYAELASGTWVQFLVRDTRPTRFSRTIRTVVITGVGDRPPPAT